ncbi:MAG: UbiA family prenyltransferase [Methanomicrobiales archaeon]|nr:UbiA family prenyltransferase [Methanomicrobiales archaeon]
MDPEGPVPVVENGGETGVTLRIRLRAFADLARIHFLPVWPLVFCSGLAIAAENYGGFTWSLAARVIVMAACGFTAGLVLNDYIDRNLDRKDVSTTFSRYWRPFGTRPIPSGTVTAGEALALFLVLAGIAVAIALTLPWPRPAWLIGLGLYSYAVEAFYQVAKRRQRFPFAQLVGRTDFALFPVAGYLCLGVPDATALLFFLAFYPWTLVHLGVNDLADLENDRARNLATIPVLYGTRGCAAWIGGWAALHLAAGILFYPALGIVPLAAWGVASVLLVIVTGKILADPTPRRGLAMLPILHLSLFISSLGILAGAVL